MWRLVILAAGCAMAACYRPATSAVAAGASSPPATTDRSPAEADAASGDAASHRDGKGPSSNAESEKSSSAKFDAADQLQQRIEAAALRYVPAEKVTYQQLKGAQFRVDRPVAGREAYIGYDTAVVSFTRPLQADYVRAMRCTEKTPVIGANGVGLYQLELGTHSAIRLAVTMEAGRFWQQASAMKSCEWVSLGTSGVSIYDINIPSGIAVRYLIQPCVTEARMETTGYDSRSTCSPWISVTERPLEMQNHHTTQMRRYETMRALARSKLEASLGRARLLGDRAIQFLDTCTEINHRNQVNKLARDTVSGLVAMVSEFALETVAAVSGIRGALTAVASTGMSKGAKILQGLTTLNDVGAVMTGAQGQTFAAMFSNLSASATDMPRTCARFDQHARDLRTELEISDTYYKAVLAYQALIVLVQQERAAAIGEIAPDIIDAPLPELEKSDLFSEEQVNQLYAAVAAKIDPDDAAAAAEGSP